MIPKGVKFGGVYSKDRLPEHPQNNTFYIINLQDFDKGGGSHWVLCWVGSDYALYYDSFGMHYPDEVQKFIGDKKIYWNNQKHQMMSSLLCGYYVILAIRYLSKDGSKVKRFSEFCNKVFGTHELSNNRKVKEIFGLK